MLDVKPTREVTDPAEAQRIAEETLQANAAQGPSARALADGCNNTRFQSCRTYIAPIDEYFGGQGGTIYLGSFEVYMTLRTRSEVQNEKSTIFVDTLAVVTGGTPEPGQFTFTLSAQRWNNQTLYTWPTKLQAPLGPNATGTMQWDDWSPKATLSFGSSTYVFEWIATVAGATYVGVLPGPFYTQQRIRCDGATAVNYGSGCVNPSFAPTVVYLKSQFPFIVPNIRAGQIDTGIGVPLSNSPLNRGYSIDNKANRDAACGSSAAAKLNLLGPPPSGMSSPSCDEYPFASTYQGGSGATVAWVPRAENDSQGQLMVDFYRKNRVLPDDDFFVNAFN